IHVGERIRGRSFRGIRQLLAPPVRRQAAQRPDRHVQLCHPRRAAVLHRRSGPGTAARGQGARRRTRPHHGFHPLRAQPRRGRPDLAVHAGGQDRCGPHDSAERGYGTHQLAGRPPIRPGDRRRVTVWSQAGYQMLPFLGGLGGIPKDYYDAAAIDGARWWRYVFSITLPMLRPTSFFILLTSAMACITGVQAFDLIFMLTQGGPADATLTMPFYIYEQAFTYNDLGYASALTLVLVAILMVAVIATFALTKGARFHEGD